MKKGAIAAAPVAIFIHKRISELKPWKTQKEIASEAGYDRPNNLSMLKHGVSKVPLERVPALAKALECDVGQLFALALEQYFEPEAIVAFRRALTADYTENEKDWIATLRASSRNGDPECTEFRKRLLYSIFRK